MDAQWLDILYKVKRKELTIEEAAKRLEEMESRPEQESAAFHASPSDPGSSTMDEEIPDIGWWKSAWQVLLWVGTGILVMSAVLMSWAYPNDRFFWFYCSFLPLTLGILLVIIGWWSRQARWVHVRILESKGTRISISIPLPIRLASWGLRLAAPFIKGLEKQNISMATTLLDSLEETRDPIWVDVDEEDGNKVKVLIL